jgi:hypothetical protein
VNATRVGAWESRSCPRYGTCACSWRRPGCSPATWPTIAGRGWRPSLDGRWRKWSSRGVTTWRCPGGAMAEPDVMVYPDSGKVGIFGGARWWRCSRTDPPWATRTLYGLPFRPPSVLRRVPHRRAGPWVSHSARSRHEAASSRRADSARQILSTGTRGTKYGDPGYKVRGPGVQSTGTRGTKYETTLKTPDLLVFLVVSQSALLFLLIYFILLQKGLRLWG